MTATAPADALLNRLRVVHIITALTTGGAERQVELVAAASRNDVRVVCLYGGGVVADALRARGVPVETLGMAGWRKAAAPLRLARLLRLYAPDVAHVHLLSGQLWGIPAARLACVPVVVSTEHSIMEDMIEGRPKTPLLRLAYLALERLSTHTIAVSPATARRLREWGVRDDRITVSNEPVDFAALRRPGTERDAVRREFGIPPEALVVGAIGRLDPVKRFDQLIRALADRLRAGMHLLVVGDGSLRGELEGLAVQLGIANAVHLIGPRPDIPRLFDGMDILVSPSRDETFGMAVVEAVGAGLPVVYAQCPALEELAISMECAIQIALDTDERDERRDLNDAVDFLLAQGLDRRPVPAELEQRYGVAATSRTVDDLYDQLTFRAGRGARDRKRVRRPGPGPQTS